MFFAFFVCAFCSFAFLCAFFCVFNFWVHFLYDDDDAFYLFLQKQKIALKPYTPPLGTSPHTSLCVHIFALFAFWCSLSSRFIRHRKCWPITKMVKAIISAINNTPQKSSKNDRIAKYTNSWYQSRSSSAILSA